MIHLYAKNKHRIILTVITLLIIVLATSALILLSLKMQTKNNANNSALTADEVISGVIKKMNYKNLTAISKENISRYYELPEDSVVDCAMYISGGTGTETELACFKIRSGTDEQSIIKCVNDYLSSKTKPSSEQNSIPVNLSDVSYHYPYIFAVVSPDSTNAVKAFEVIINETPQK